MFIGIDQSKRSTALVCINDEGALKNFLVIAAPMSVDNEEMLEWQWNEIRFFVRYCETTFGDIKGIAIEGLSFNSSSSGKDLLAGLFWYIRTMLYLQGYRVGVIPVLAWRSKVIAKDERKAISALKHKDGIKKATVAKLPFEVKAQFETYIRDHKLKQQAIYDLCDAYFIAQYRRSIE